ncbi:MAG: response regulator transcription factor [Pseudomonadota bacterium]|nr:MAG: response regulator transcription factor [Pseudomonadota bacterium]
MSGRLRVVIIDDELPALGRLARLVEADAQAELCGQCSDPADAVDLCRRVEPDVVLLDVEMPSVDGIGVARRLRRLNHAPAIIFVTAFERYAVEAFEVAAVDYLVKPVRPERLNKALARAASQPGGREPCLKTRLGDRVLTIPVGDIRALIAEDKYTVVHFDQGQALVEDSLVLLEQRFPQHFLRTHRKALVARRYLRGLFRDQDGQERAVLDGSDCHPPISRRSLAAVRRCLEGEA